MKVIEKTNNRIVIEHNNFRTIVSPDMFAEYENGFQTADDLSENGIPVSVKWSDFIDIYITGNDIEQTLYQHGIHTVDDLLKNPAAVSGAILATIGLSAGTIYKLVKQDQKKQ